MKRAIYRQVGPTRFTARPRRAPTGSFSQLLAKLTGASGQLQKARRQARGR